jgi:uncharacterized protein (DUF362 family)
VESSAVWNGDRRDPAVLARMLDHGLQALTGESAPSGAWRRFFSPGMRVGLKINLLGRPLVYTARELTEAVAAGVIATGVKAGDVIVWDRFRDHFPPTDYVVGRGLHGERIEVGGAYDATRAARTSGGLCPIDSMVTQRTDITVNMPVLKDHGGSGVTMALKNLAFGCFEHHRNAHDGYCDPYIAEVNQHFFTVARAPLIILDATRACFDGGPRPADRARIWNENAIYLATDPVALDAVSRRVIAARRRVAGLVDRTAHSRHIETAAGKGLGVVDLSLVEQVTVRV